MSRAIITASIEDAEHFTPERRIAIAEAYPEWERDARVRGVPSLGSGKVFLLDETKLLVDSFDCPSHWVKLGGMDFGWTHYAAFCECWWDRDLDIFYLVRSIRLKEQNSAAACRGGAQLALEVELAGGRQKPNPCRRWHSTDAAIRRCWTGHDARARAV